MSDAPKKRPWLQFHLSTAVVLMFVAAGLLWLNMPKQTYSAKDAKVTAIVPGGADATPPPAPFPMDVWQQGWPLEWRLVLEDTIGGVSPPRHEETGYWNLTLDIGAALAMLSVVGVACEQIIRRRERRP